MRARLWPPALLAAGLLLCTGTSSHRVEARQPAKAAGDAMAPLDPAAVDRSIQLGVRFLRSSQHPQGHWGAGTGPGSAKGWAVGYTCLAGITLVECGVPTSDAGLRAALSGVRRYATELDSTYEVALAILFLDRMGEKSDSPTIRMLAGRLVAGQSATGGWAYKVPKQSGAESAALFSALRKMSPPPPPQSPSVRERPGSLGLCIKTSDDVFVKPPPAFDPVKARKVALESVPAKMQKLPVLQDASRLILEDPKDKRDTPTTGTTDNSNTHFAILGLWAARKHDVPADRSFALLVNRFRTSQGPNGTWSYEFAHGGANGPVSMTCVALLGLAIGHVLDADPNVRPEKDQKIVNAFAALSPRIGMPAGEFANRPAIKDVGGLYFLWAMERIAVLYDVRQLDKKDWYRWGAEILIGRQSTDGSWAEDGGYHGHHPVLNTCFALMFLKRANLTPDLSRRLTVDVAALTAKVDDKVSPRPPVKPVEPPKVSEPEPAPEPPVKEEEPPPRKDPPRTPTIDAPAPAATTPAAESKSSGWIWILLLVVLALVGGGITFLAIRRARNGHEDEQPRKKKGAKKKRVQVELDEDE